jgi:hypothetical protein
MLEHTCFSSSQCILEIIIDDGDLQPEFSCNQHLSIQCFVLSRFYAFSKCHIFCKYSFWRLTRPGLLRVYMFLILMQSRFNLDFLHRVDNDFSTRHAESLTSEDRMKHISNISTCLIY